MGRDSTAAARSGPTRARGSFRFQLVGRFTASRDGEPFAEREIGSRKGRTLLKVLLISPDEPVSVDRLCDILWADDPPANVERVLASLVSRLRSLLGADTIEGGAGTYRLRRGRSIEIDLVEAESLAGQARARLVHEPALAWTAARRGLELVGAGTVLAGEPDSDWVEPARASLVTLRRDLRRSGWEAALELDDPDTAVELAAAALRDDPLDEEACRALMAACQRRGQVAEGLRAFERLRVALADELGVDPAGATHEVHRALLRGEAPAKRPRPSTAAPSRSHDARAPASEVSATFVGRQEEQTRLDRCWTAAVDGEPGLVLIVGEAGIGKTRLAEELVATVEDTGGDSLRARCYEAERSLFLGPIVDLVGALVRRVPPDHLQRAVGPWAGTLVELVPDIAAILGDQRYEPSTADLERRRTFQATSTLFRQLSWDRPLLVFLDDLHNAGASTVELLHYLLRHAVDSRLLVVATCRVGEGGEALHELAEVSERIDLGPLPDVAVTTLVRRAGAMRFAPHILATTRGHTLSVVETLRALAEADDGVETPPVPASLQVAVLERLQRAGPEVEELLRGAATLGSTFELPVAARLLDLSLEEAVRRSERAVAARLLVADGPRFAFSNDLVQQIVYDSTSRPVRVARHARAAELLEGNPEAVGHHASAAGDWQRALDAWLEAADQAARRYANRDAELLLGHAITAGESADDPAGLARARLARAVVREAMADYAGALKDLEAARELARTSGRPDLEAIALRELGGDVLIGLGRPSTDCLPYLETGLDVAQAPQLGRIEVELLGRIAVLWTNRARFDRATEAAEQALQRARELEDDGALAMALDAVKNVSAYAGDLERLEAVVPELERLLLQEDDLRIRQWLQWAEFESAMLPLARAEWDRAEEILDRVVVQSGRTGHPWRSLFLAHRSWLHRAHGDYGQAIADARTAREPEVSAEHPWWNAFAAAMLGWVLSDVGEQEETVRCLEEGVTAAERHGMETYLIRCVCHLALAHWRAGDRDAAARDLERAERLLDDVTTPPDRAFLHGASAYAAAARVYLGCGQVGEALRLLDVVRGPAASVGWHEVVVTDRILRGRGYLLEGALGRARTLLAEGAQVAESVGLVPLAWEGHVALAHVATAAGDDTRRIQHEEAAAHHLAVIAGSIEDPNLRDVLTATAARRREVPSGEPAG